jgi:DnaK suppressor protein
VKSPAKKPAARTATVAAKAIPLKAKPAIQKPAAKAAPIAKSPAAAKQAAKPIAKLPAKLPVKVTAKAVVKAVLKTAAKPAAKKAAPAVPAKKAPIVAPLAAPVVKTALKAAPKPPATAKAVPAPPPEPIVHVTGIIKAVRPSSRLVQITVPSMAQSVASTAAKSSFLPTEARDELHPLVPHAIKKDPKLVGNWKKKAPGDLSDPELIAMPDSEYMNDVQMAAFRLKLVVLKNGILSNAGATTEHLREDTSVMPDPADRATIEEEHALELRTRDRERKLLKKIEQAISRIDSNEYGYCDETGEPIGVGRLLARPTATLSLEAQQRRELKQKMFGD